MKKHLLLAFLLMVISMGFAQKNVLVEELTGTWCQWCPRGIYYGDSLTLTYDNVVLVAIHSSDPMQCNEYYQASGLVGAPTANIARRYRAQETDDWFEKVQQEMSMQSAGTLSVAEDFDIASRILSMTVTVTAQSELTNSYKVGVVLVEDAVTGPAPTFNQSNSYSGGAHGPLGGYENMPNPIPADRIAYDHVARCLVTPYAGQPETVPNLQPGQSTTCNFTCEVADYYDYNYVRPVVYLVAYDASIDNVIYGAYLNGSDNAAPKFTSTPKTESNVNLNYLYNIYFHDTDDPKDVNITMTSGPSWLTLEQYDHQSAALYGIPSVPGNYEVTLTLNDGTITTDQTFTIEVQNPLGGSWEYVGDRGFSMTAMRTFGVKSDSQGNVYVFGSENDIAVVYKYDGTAWTKLGNTNTSCGVSWNEMDIDSNDNIYIGFSESGSSYTGHVLKWDGSTWTSIGSAFEAAEPHVFIAPDDTPYLLIRDVSQNYMGALFRLENNVWTPLSGTGIYAPSEQYGLWHTMTFDHNGVPYVCYADYMGGNAIHVVRFLNGEWAEVGQSIGSVYYYMGIAINNSNNPYVAYCNGNGHKLSAARFNGYSWENIGEDILTSTIEEMDACMVDDKFTVAALNTGQGNYLSVVQYDGEWAAVGQSLCSEGIIDLPCVGNANGMVLVAFKDDDQEGKASCMRYVEETVLYPPTNLAAEVFGNDNVLLTWGLPIEGTPTGYVVYRDDARVTIVTDVRYEDFDLTPGTHRYTVSALYDEEESVQVGPVTVETTLGVIEANDMFQVYPTLVKDVLHLQVGESGLVKVYSMTGQLMLQSEVSENSNDIDVSALSAGIYMVACNGHVVRIVKR